MQPAEAAPPAREPRAGLAAASRILVIRLGALGDVVRTRFAFAGLRALYPEARIDWLVEDRAAAGLEGIVGLDARVLVRRDGVGLGRPSSLWRVAGGVVGELRATGYDLAVDFHSILKSALFAWAARIPVRVGYGRGLAREGSQRLMTHTVEIAGRQSRFERNAALVRFLGGEVPSNPPPLELPPGSGEALEGLPGEFFAIHPGTSPSTLYKRWDPDRFAAVARSLWDRVGIPSLVTWGPVPGERECAERVVERAGGAARLAPRTAGIAAMLALLGRARLFIGCDSGPMHLASLAGSPVVAVFGPTDPIENAPFPGLPSRVLRRDVGCNPCREGCPVRACMAAVEPEAVAGAALDLIAAGSAAH